MATRSVSEESDDANRPQKSKSNSLERFPRWGVTHLQAEGPSDSGAKKRP